MRASISEISTLTPSPLPPAREGAARHRAGSSDYARIERALRYLDQHHLEQPSLADLAQFVGVSEFHFHRLFHRWAGITPKSFLRFATLSHAKWVLRESESLLDSSLALGLSGPSRLHDLFLSLEGMTPGDYKLRAAGIVVRWGVHETPFGEAVFAATNKGLSGLSFVEGDPAQAVEEIRHQWPGARWQEDATFTRRYSDELTSRCRGQPPKPLSLLLKGTPFQLKVWEALLRIPEGAVVSYGSLAKLLELPKAARAVGTAVAANPIAYLIPCHRVIRATGVFGGYHWGEARKRAILTVEQARRSA